MEIRSGSEDGKNVFEKEGYVVTTRPFRAVRDRAITADAAAIDFELVQMAASEVIVVLEQLMDIFKARGEVKNLNSSITEIEELETRMSTLEVMVEELDFQAWSEQARSSGTGSGRGSPAIDMSTLSVMNASVAPATHSVLVACTSSSSGQREFGSSTGSVVPTIKFEPGTTLTSSSVQNAVSMSKPVSKPAGNVVRTPQTTSVAVTTASAPTVGCSGVPGNAVHMPQAPSVAATATTFAPRVTAQQHMTNSYYTLPGLPAPLTYQPHQQPMLTHQPRQQHYQQPYQPSYPGPPPPSVMSQQNFWNPGPTANTYTYGPPPPTARHTTGDVFSKMSRVTIPGLQWRQAYLRAVEGHIHGMCRFGTCEPNHEVIAAAAVLVRGGPEVHRKTRVCCRLVHDGHAAAGEKVWWHTTPSDGLLGRNRQVQAHPWRAGESPGTGEVGRSARSRRVKLKGSWQIRRTGGRHSLYQDPAEAAGGNADQVQPLGL